MSNRLRVSGGWVLIAALLATAFFLAFTAKAQTVYSTKQVRTLRINALAVNVDRWSGWIDVPNFPQVQFDIDYVHGTGTATAVTMRCETSHTTATLNDAGRDLHAITGTSALGVSTSVTHTWSNAVSSAEQWTWSVSGITAPFINCLFQGTLAGAADTVTVNTRGVTP